MTVCSTPEQIAEALAFYATWTANETDEQKHYAQGRSTVFSIMQYRVHKDTGEVLWVREQWDALISALDELGILEAHAAIWHDKDHFPDGRDKPLHFHGVIRLKPGFEKQIRFLAIRASLPASRIRRPGDAYAEGKVVTGRLAADISFYDFCQYLVHEDERSREQGKFQYPRDEVAASFDFGAFLDAGRPAKAKNSRTKATPVDMLALAIQEEGLTLREAKRQDPLAYNRAIGRMERSRGVYLSSMEAPSMVMNFYISGIGGVGKDLLARALARSLAPDVESPFFVVGGQNVTFQKYDGQPVLIWEDHRAGAMVAKVGGRGELFSLLGPYRDPGASPDVNVKHGSTRLVNAFNIVTGPDDYRTFLDGLAGEYAVMQGGVKVQHKAENKGQAYRRFPVIIPVSEGEYDIYVNKGFLDGTREYEVYEEYRHMRQGLEALARRAQLIEDAVERAQVLADRERATVLPILEQVRRLEISGEAISADEVLAEFADVGTPLPFEETALGRAQVEADEMTARLNARGEAGHAWVNGPFEDGSYQVEWEYTA